MLRGSRTLLLLLTFAVLINLILLFNYIFYQHSFSVHFKLIRDSYRNNESTVKKVTEDDFKVSIVMLTPEKSVDYQVERVLNTVNKLNGETDCSKQCKWTMDRNMVSKADALVFYFFAYGYKLDELPMEDRNSNQIWAMYLLEPPQYLHCDLKKLNGVFNWSINYRKDSDIWSPYGRKFPKSIESNWASIQIGNSTLDQWVAGKKDLVVQVVSRCKARSKREILLEKLKQAGLPVKVYGACGEQLCARHDEDCTDFWDEIGRKYKFYLAFENSICTDYITEKFWRSLEIGMVPVVYGGGDYLNDAPPNSYIDVRSFSSAKELTEYLLKIDKDPEMYKQFFEWRKYFRTRKGGGVWCNLCMALHERKRFITKSTKVYEDLYAWNWKRDPITHNNTACEENPHFFTAT